MKNGSSPIRNKRAIMAMAQNKEDKEMMNKNLRKLAHHRVKQQVLIKSKDCPHQTAKMRYLVSSGATTKN